MKLTSGLQRASSRTKKPAGTKDWRPSMDVVLAITTFLDKAEPERVDVARPEAERVLGLIVETAGDENLREMAAELIDEMP